LKKGQVEERWGVCMISAPFVGKGDHLQEKREPGSSRRKEGENTDTTLGPTHWSFSWTGKEGVVPGKGRGRRLPGGRQEGLVPGGNQNLENRLKGLVS